MTNKYILELFTVSMNSSRNPTCQEPSHAIKVYLLSINWGVCIELLCCHSFLLQVAK